MSTAIDEVARQAASEEARQALINGQPYEALSAICRAIRLTPRTAQGDDVLASKVAALKHFAEIHPQTQGTIWCQWVLTLAIAVRRLSDGATDVPADVKVLAGKRVTGPIMFVAGGCEDAHSVEWARLVDLLDGALGDVERTLVSGGTRSGVSQLVGDLIERRPHCRRGMCWLPDEMPSDVSIDERYEDRRVSEVGDGASGFTPAEPLRSWMTVLASGIAPADVVLLGINGGRISGFEYELAATLGARVGLLHPTGRAVDALHAQRHRLEQPSVEFLPLEQARIAAFVSRDQFGVEAS